MKLLQTSSSNDILTTIFRADKESGTGVLPFLLQDKETGDKFTVPNSWINKQPTVVRGQGVNTMEWTLRGDMLI
jgi:hypothetical protein